MRILNTIGQVLTPEARAILEGVGCLDDRALSQGELAEVIGEYDAALVGLGLTFDSRVLARAEKLRVIATATTGLDHIDLNAALVRDIEVLSLRGEEEFLNTITGTAELAFGMLIDLARRVPWAFESVRRYEWNREAFRGHSLSGKTLGIVGLGRLGRIMARQAAGFGMRVIFFDPYVRASSPRFFGKTPDVDRARGHAAFYAAASNGVEDLLRNKASGVRGGQADEAEEEAEEGQTLLSQCRGGSDPPRAGAFTAKAEKVDFDELLRESDAVSIHAHLTPETEGMFGEREFALMKPSVYLINTSRGKIVNERALLAALKQNKIAGYATDVLADELSFESAGFSKHPLVEYAEMHENLLIVPHIGGMTVESREATDVFIARKLAQYLRESLSLRAA